MVFFLLRVLVLGLGVEAPVCDSVAPRNKLKPPFSKDVVFGNLSLSCRKRSPAVLMLSGPVTAR